MKRLPDDLATKLLKAADALPEGRGFDVSIDELAKLSGVPRATLYYYFSGKEDVVQFYVNNLLERTAGAMNAAASAGGTVVERLGGTLTAMLHEFATNPRMCVELPALMKEIREFGPSVAHVEQAVLAPVRELLIEGRATRELVVSDVDLAAVSLLGAVHMVAMMDIVTTGQLDADGRARALVPQLMRGLLPR